MTPTATSVTATVTIDSTAASGDREVAVLYPGGKSNTKTFTVNAHVDPNFVISNLRAGPAHNTFNGFDVPVTVDFVDPQGASVTGDARVNFSIDVGISGWTMPATVNGTTSGTTSITISIYGFSVPAGVDVPISISVERPAGERRSNTLSGTFRRD